ncbi:MAG TPA: redoxin domain-containing protein [Oculatellaceae cyanobacterium]|jgi:peroxiredoxin
MLNPPLLEIGSTAPAFHLLDQSGRIVTLESAAGPQGLVLVFFASHLLPGDRKILEACSQAYPDLQQAGLELVAISGLNWETLYKLSQQCQLPYRVLFDPCCRISKRYKAMLIPKFVTGRAMYVLNSQGQIISASREIQLRNLQQLLML